MLIKKEKECFQSYNIRQPKFVKNNVPITANTIDASWYAGQIAYVKNPIAEIAEVNVIMAKILFWCQI